jgi:hypothetical protein
LSTLLFGHLCHLANDYASPKAFSTLRDVVAIEMVYSSLKKDVLFGKSSY